MRLKEIVAENLYLQDTGYHPVVPFKEQDTNVRDFYHKEAAKIIDTHQERSIERRSKMTKKQKPNNHKRRQILDFARDNNMVIHPGGGYEYYIKTVFEVGHCPCARERLECPCPESIEEVKKDGWCKCRLFWRDLDTYKNSYVKE